MTALIRLAMRQVYDSVDFVAIDKLALAHGPGAGSLQAVAAAHCCSMHAGCFRQQRTERMMAGCRGAVKCARALKYDWFYIDRTKPAGSAGAVAVACHPSGLHRLVALRDLQYLCQPLARPRCVARSACSMRAGRMANDRRRHRSQVALLPLPNLQTTPSASPSIVQPSICISCYPPCPAAP